MGKNKKNILEGKVCYDLNHYSLAFVKLAIFSNW